MRGEQGVRKAEGWLDRLPGEGERPGVMLRSVERLGRV